MAASRIILSLTAIGFMSFGVAFSLWPEPMARLVQISLPTPTARIDFAATYGGFELGFGAFLLACLRRPAWMEAGLCAGVAALGGFAVVRLLGLFGGGGSVSSAIYVGLALEISGVALNLWGLRLWRRSQDRTQRADGPAAS